MFNMLYDFCRMIDKSHFWSVVFAAVIIFGCIFLVRGFFTILFGIRNFIVEKTNYVRALCIQLTNNDGQLLPIDKRVKVTNSVMDLIDLSIDIEIANELRRCMALGETYVVSNMDDSIKNIGTAVFEGLNTDIFTDPNLLYTSTYFQKFITSRTKNKMMDAVKAYNDTLRQFTT